jgi:hypothetical protein
MRLAEIAGSPVRGDAPAVRGGAGGHPHAPTARAGPGG